jgi:broad specificity phosphatase PhoE
MSSGAEHRAPNRVTQTNELENKLLRSGGAPSLMRRWQKVDTEHDIPYGSGYNVDGTIVYIDKDLAAAVHDGRVDTGLSAPDTLECLCRHERVEKVLLDANNPIDSYREAHDFATAAEHHLVREKGSTPARYERGLAPLFKLCASKVIENVPADYACAAALDINDERILKALQDHGVDDADHVSRESVSYGRAAGKDRCSTCSMWGDEQNAMLAHCTMVNGLVRTDRVCDRFDPADSAEGVGGPRELILYRHGETKLNNNSDASVDRLRGWLNVPLSPAGEQQAEEAGERAAKHPPDVILTSDLKRAHDTARAISRYTHVPISEASKAFRPWDVGKLAGKVTKRVLPILDDYATNHPDKPIEGGESFNSFCRRFLCGVYDALQKYKGRILLVAHHRNDRALHAWAAGGFDPHGQIDLKVFNQKGTPTGGDTVIEIPMEALERFAMTGPEEDGVDLKVNNAESGEATEPNLSDLKPEGSEDSDMPRNSEESAEKSDVETKTSESPDQNPENYSETKPGDRTAVFDKLSEAIAALAAKEFTVTIPKTKVKKIVRTHRDSQGNLIAEITELP